MVIQLFSLLLFSLIPFFFSLRGDLIKAKKQSGHVLQHVQSLWEILVGDSIDLSAAELNFRWADWCLWSQMEVRRFQDSLSNKTKQNVGLGSDAVILKQAPSLYNKSQ